VVSKLICSQIVTDHTLAQPTVILNARFILEQVFPTRSYGERSQPKGNQGSRYIQPRSFGGSRTWSLFDRATSCLYNGESTQSTLLH
jgi:hypothetical protein